MVLVFHTSSSYTSLGDANIKTTLPRIPCNSMQLHDRVWARRHQLKVCVRSSGQICPSSSFSYLFFSGSHPRRATPRLSLPCIPDNRSSSRPAPECLCLLHHITMKPRGLVKLQFLWVLVTAASFTTTLPHPANPTCSDISLKVAQCNGDQLSQQCSGPPAPPPLHHTLGWQLCIKCRFLAP